MRAVSYFVIIVGRITSDRDDTPLGACGCVPTGVWVGDTLEGKHGGMYPARQTSRESDFERQRKKSVCEMTHTGKCFFQYFEGLRVQAPSQILVLHLLLHSAMKK